MSNKKNQKDNTAIMKALEWIVDIDQAAIIASVNAERNDNPGISKDKLVNRLWSRARWKATIAGVATGLPGNIFIALPAATTDVAITLKTEIIAAARTAVIYDDNFFNDEDAKYVLLVPIFGLSMSSQLMREMGIRGGMGLTRVAIRKYLSKETLVAFKKIMIKYFSMKVTQKGLITKTLPLIGGLIGGAWNYIEVGRVKRRTIRYFNTMY